MATYSSASNAARAARKFLNNIAAVAGKDFTITKDEDGEFGFELVSHEVEDQSQDPADVDPVAEEIAAGTDIADAPEDDGFEQPARVEPAAEAAEVTELEKKAQAKAARKAAIKVAGEANLEARALTAPAKPMRVAKAPKADKPEKVARVHRADGLVEGSSMAKLVDAAKDKAGKTHEEYCAIVSWGQCLPMLKKSVEKAGLTFKTIKVKGEKTRYFAE